MTEYIILSLITPFLILGVGLVMKVYPPNQINNRVGFRTKSAQADHESWMYAQRTWAKYLIMTSFIEIGLSALQIYFVWTYLQEQILIVVFVLLSLQLMGLIIPYVQTKRLVDTYKKRKKEAFLKKIKEDSVKKEQKGE